MSKSNSFTLLTLTLLMSCSDMPQMKTSSETAGVESANGEVKSGTPYTNSAASNPTGSNAGSATNGTAPSASSMNGSPATMGSPATVMNPAAPSNPMAPSSPSPSTGSNTGMNTGGGAQASGPCTSLDLANVKKPEDFACLGSVDAIFKNNPAWLKKHFTLFHASKSAQGATMEYPRVIVSSPDGSFIFATATLPDSRKEVEIAVYDYQNETWQFAGIDFTSGSAKIEKNSCKACHGGDVPHTNWKSYGIWTGAYGQGGDHGLTSEQATMVNKFKNKQAGTPDIMKNLDFSIVQGLEWAGPNEIETNEGIGYMMAFKAGRSLAAKIIKKGTKAQVRDVILETICADSSSSQTATTLGLPLSVHLQTAPDAGEGKSYRSINVGYNSNVWYFGLVMMVKALEADPALAAAAPQAVAFAKSKGTALMMTNGITDYLAKMPKGGGIYLTSRSETDTPGPFASTGAICTSIKKYAP